MTTRPLLSALQPCPALLLPSGYPKPYEALKELTRTNSVVTQQSLHEFIDTYLQVSDSVKV